MHFTWIEALANEGKFLKSEVDKFPITEEMMEVAITLANQWEDEGREFN